MAAHADADNRNLGDVGGALNFELADVLFGGLQGLERARQLAR